MKYVVMFWTSGESWEPVSTHETREAANLWLKSVEDWYDKAYKESVEWDKVDIDSQDESIPEPPSNMPFNLQGDHCLEYEYEDFSSEFEFDVCEVESDSIHDFSWALRQMQDHHGKVVKAEGHFALKYENASFYVWDNREQQWDQIFGISTPTLVATGWEVIPDPETTK